MSNDRDEAIRLARECGFQTLLPEESMDLLGGVWAGDENIISTLKAFYLSAKAKGAEEENEACAKVYEEGISNPPHQNFGRNVLLAATIRARKEKERQCP